MKVEPYLAFNGNCEEAFNFYKKVFGGDFESIMRFKDMPGKSGMEYSEEEKEKIMHVMLPMGENNLMGSDAPGQKTEFGNNVSLSVQTENEEQTNEIFGKLSEEGKILMPLSKTFWNAYFGVCVDKFGVQWMLNFDYGGNENG